MGLYRRQIMEMEVIADHPFIRFKELRKSLKIHPVYLLRDLRRLRKHNFIERSGSVYFYKYRLSYKGYLYMKIREYKNLLRSYIELEESYNG